MTDNPLLHIVIQYLEAIERKEPVENILQYYSPNAEQAEYPNLLTKNLAKRSVSDIRKGYESGLKVLKKQSYEILKSYVFENTVIIETVWRGTLAIPVGQKVIGDDMIAHFCQIYEFEDDRIIRQRNYDCFEPF